MLHQGRRRRCPRDERFARRARGARLAPSDRRRPARARKRDDGFAAGGSRHAPRERDARPRKQNPTPPPPRERGLVAEPHFLRAGLLPTRVEVEDARGLGRSGPRPKSSSHPEGGYAKLNGRYARLGATPAANAETQVPAAASSGACRRRRSRRPRAAGGSRARRRSHRSGERELTFMPCATTPAAFFTEDVRGLQWRERRGGAKVKWASGDDASARRASATSRGRRPHGRERRAGGPERAEPSDSSSTHRRRAGGQEEAAHQHPLPAGCLALPLPAHRPPRRRLLVASRRRALPFGPDRTPRPLAPDRPQSVRGRGRARAKAPRRVDAAPVPPPRRAESRVARRDAPRPSVRRPRRRSSAARRAGQLRAGSGAASPPAAPAFGGPREPPPQRAGIALLQSQGAGGAAT